MVSLPTPAEKSAARFDTHWDAPGTAVITVHGEIDAANADEFADYALRHADQISRLVLDVRGVEFFATAGFAALQGLHVRCAGESIAWCAVPSTAVTRLLVLCDPESELPRHDDVDAAVDSLQLVSKSR